MRRLCIPLLSLIWVAAALIRPVLVGAGALPCAPFVPSGSTGYWHTAGTRIVDGQGRTVRIAAVNWYGMEDQYFVPEGLNNVPLDTLLGRVRDLGFNTIRLAFSNQMVESNPIVTAHLGANPELRGLHALAVLDRIVAVAGRLGLRIILENHRSSVGESPDEYGLWYTARYPERVWIRDWQRLTRRYANNPTVVGFDLRNEPHTRPPGPWSVRTYLRQGATWGWWHHQENRATDWRLAAERGGNAVLKINRHLLIIVEGITQYPDSAAPGGIDTSWWGSILGPAARFPVQLAVSHQLVYSPHEYGPVKHAMPWFSPHMRYGSLISIWTKHWAYLDAPTARYQVPIFLGEFGTCGTSTTCVTDTTPGSQGFWFSSLMRYLKTHPEVGWSFWALDAVNPHGKIMVNYILNPDWSTVRLPALINAFHEVEAVSCTSVR
jgi:endoglucanase